MLRVSGMFGVDVVFRRVEYYWNKVDLQVDLYNLDLDRLFDNLFDYHCVNLRVIYERWTR